MSTEKIAFAQILREPQSLLALEQQVHLQQAVL
jgi:hypothetical protein